MNDPRVNDLIELLDGFDPAGDIEVEHLLSFMELLTAANEPFSRNHFDPGHITASAFVVHPSSRRVLLHHHRRLDRWLQMGGHVDEGESVVAAALREATEESGLTDLQFLDDRPFDINVHDIPEGKGEPHHLHYDVRFIVQTAEPAAAAIANDESLDLEWLDLDEARRRMNAAESTRALKKIGRRL